MAADNIQASAAMAQRGASIRVRLVLIRSSEWLQLVGSKRDICSDECYMLNDIGVMDEVTSSLDSTRASGASFRPRGADPNRLVGSPNDHQSQHFTNYSISS